MKNRRYLSTLLLALAGLLWSISASADSVSQEKASALALRILSARSGARLASGPVPSSAGVKLVGTSLSLPGAPALKASQADPTYYIFASESGRGYVIVSGESLCRPVLGYSFSSTFGDGPLPDNLAWWLGHLDAQIKAVRESGDSGSGKYAAQWDMPRAGTPVVEIETAKWGQGEPFNRYCPMDGSNRSVTGCVQTATAIIMKHHRWPSRGNGWSEAYTTASKEIEVPERNLNNIYDWDLMPMTYPYRGYTDAQADMVATLMADLGAAFQADYGSDGTGAWVRPAALLEHFGYSPSVHETFRENYSDET